MKVDETHIKCCELQGPEINLENETEEDLNSSSETVIDAAILGETNENIIRELSCENESLSSENKLLKKLISEMEDKNALLL